MAEKQTDPIAKIGSQLSEYEAALTGELLELKESERTVKEKLRQVKAMQRASGSLGTESEKPRLPAPKKAEVIQMVVSALEAGPLTEEELKNKVAGKLKTDHTLVGFPLRMKEALGTEFFEVDSEGLVHLVAKNTANARKSQL